MDVILSPKSEQHEAIRRLTTLVKVGRKNAILGVDPSSKAAATRWWHVARPGTISTAEVLDPNGFFGLSYARSYCRRRIVTNGMAQDFTPGDRVFCPACKEQL